MAARQYPVTINDYPSGQWFHYKYLNIEQAYRSTWRVVI